MAQSNAQEMEQAMTETNLCVLENQFMAEHLEASISVGGNIAFIGSRGSGKTFSAKQTIRRLGYHEVYSNISTKERPELGGIPKVLSDAEYVEYRFVEEFKSLIEGGKVPDFKSSLKNLALGDFNNSEQQQIHAAAEWALKYPIHQITIDGSNADVIAEIAKTLHSLGVKAEIVPNPVAGSDYKFRATKSDPLECVWVLDEVDKADPSIFGPLLEIVQFRSVNGTKFPYLKAIVMTGNMLHEGGQKIIPPLTDRCEMYIIRQTIDGFQYYSNNIKRIHPGVMSFVIDTPQCLTNSPSNIETAYKTASSRTFEYVSDLATEFEAAEARGVKSETAQRIFYKRIQGFVGAEVGQQMIVYFDHYMSFLPIIRPIFAAVKEANRAKALEAVDTALDKIKQFDSTTKQLVLFMTMMNNYINHVDTAICAFKGYNKVKYDKMSNNQKRDHDTLCAQTTVLIDAVGRFFARAATDKTSTSRGGNDSHLMTGDLLLAILRNGVSVQSKWGDYISGNEYAAYLKEYVERNPIDTFKYSNYDCDIKKVNKGTKTGLIEYQLYRHPDWYVVLNKFAESSDEVSAKLKEAYSTK